MLRTLALACLAAVAAVPAASAQPSSPAAQQGLALWRLDCGAFVMKHYGAFFSDAFQYADGAKNLVASCYLIRHGDQYMLWDTGVTDALVGHPLDDAQNRITLRRSIVDQLGQIGVRPEQIAIVGISHWHFDHTGQAQRFPGARLLIGHGDVELLRSPAPPEREPVEALAHWLNGPGRLEPVDGDRDVFGDRSVVMLALPGHTPGHHGLLVRLASGAILLSGDTYHFTEQVPNRGVPGFNFNRADSLASMDRFDRIARNLHARIVIQHEPADVTKLPAFPTAAR